MGINAQNILLKGSVSIISGDPQFNPIPAKVCWGGGNLPPP